MRFIAPLVLLVVLAFAAPARADITVSEITTPQSPRFVLSQGTDKPFDVAGTAKGTGDVDIVCATSSSSTVLAAGVPVGRDGSFSASAVVDARSLGSDGRTCRLHAVPAGTAPDELVRFPGPVLAVSRFTTSRVDAGPNAGLVDGFHVWVAGTGRATLVTAFGSPCGLYSAVLGPATLEPEDHGFACAGSMVDALGVAPAGVQVDGLAAFPAAYVTGHGLGELGGLPSLTEPSVDFDETTGAAAVREHAGFARCAPDPSYPYNAQTCTSLAAMPVELRRTTSVLAGDQIVRVVDRWSSTDGAAHQLDLLLDHGRCCSARYVYRFPGETGFAPHDRDDTTPDTDRVAGPFAAGSPILARAEDGGGAGVFVLPMQSADGARFIRAHDFGLEYRDRTIPAHGELEFTHYYVTTRAAGDLEGAASSLLASLRTPPAPGPHTAPAPAPKTKPAVTTPTAPRLWRRGHVRVRRAGRTFTVVTRDRVTCAATCDVQVRGRRIVPTDRHVAPGRTAAVRFRLTRAGARKLRRAGTLRLRVSLSAGTVPATRTLRIRAPE